jgi:hypothetical protein
MSKDIKYLLTPTAIRERSNQILALAKNDLLNHLSLHEDQIHCLSRALLEEIHQNYPDRNIPYHSRWRHFYVDGSDRIDRLNSSLDGLSSIEACMAKLELTIISVLLDAGAGNSWNYIDKVTGKTFARSEGLAIASLNGFASGVFGEKPFTASADSLRAISVESLEQIFQVTSSNPLAGVEGRVALINTLGECARSMPCVLPSTTPRLGNIFGIILEQTTENILDAEDLLAIVLTAFGSIWPGRLLIDGIALGDVWKHSQVRGEGKTDGLVPFHKLSQWLTYSLLEPLESFGIQIVGLEKLTGLAEYRNGGLFIDAGVIALRESDNYRIEYSPSSELIVEWRALTIALLDQLASQLRADLGVSTEELPLAKILQGGTWSLGRKFANRARTDGSPPLAIKSDGTVF